MVIILLLLACRIAIAGQPQTIFFGQLNDADCSTTIQLLAVSTAGLPITYTFIQGKGILVNNNLFTPSKPGKYIIRASQSGNATFDSAASVTREFMVISSKQTEAATISFKVKAPLCIGNPGDISLTSIAGVDYKWSLNDGKSFTGINYHINTIVSSLNCSGVIRIIEGNCEVLNFSLALVANPKTSISFSLPDSIISGDTISLAGIPTGGTFMGTGVLDTVFFAPSILQITTEAITYQYKNSGGCVSEIQRIATVYPQPVIAEIKPKIYEYITPNGDSKNDFFIIENIQMFPHNELIIFNAWGNVLHKETGYINTWSPELAKGIYYYDLKVTDTGKHYTGHFYVSP